VFPVALNLRGRAVLVIGGTDEATEKVPKLIAAGARVKIVALAVSGELARLARLGALSWYARELADQDVQGAHMVFLTEQDPVLAQRLRALASAGRFLICAIDQPAFSDVYLVSTVRSGPISISISTGGRAPLLARRIRQSLERALGPQFSEFARNFARLRTRLRELPRPERTRLLTQALEGFAMDVRVSYPRQDGLGAGDPSEGAHDGDFLTPGEPPLD
jgi:precorrin-2 dehydrogenase / sirohydrochlorin ferrochelatase